MSLLKPIYKTLRSVVITMIMLSLIVYVGVYVLLSIPAVQNNVKTIACKELSVFLGGNLNVGKLNIAPFNEIIIDDVELYSPKGEKCIEIKKVAAALDLWAFLAKRKVILNYAELKGVDASILQLKKDGPLNIEFLIEALSPKDKTKPQTNFNLRFRNIVVRDSKIFIKRPWMRNEIGFSSILSDMMLSDVRLDLSIPILRNDLFRFDIRNLRCAIHPGIELKRFTAQIDYKKGDGKLIKDEVSVKDLKIELPGSSLSMADFSINLDMSQPINAQLNGIITPSDFVELCPPLKHFESPWNIGIDAIAREDSVGVRNVSLHNNSTSADLSCSGNVNGITTENSMDLNVDKFNAYLPKSLLSIVADAFPSLNSKYNRLLLELGDVSVDMVGRVKNMQNAEISGNLETELGKIEFVGNAEQLKSHRPKINLSVDAFELEVGDLVGNDKLGRTSFSLDAAIEGIDKNATGSVDLLIEKIIWDEVEFNEIELNVDKTSDNLQATLNSMNDELYLDLDAEMNFKGAQTTLDAKLALARFNTSLLGLKNNLADNTVRLNLDVHTIGNDINNLTGSIRLSDFNLTGKQKKSLSLSSFILDVDTMSGYKNDSNIFPARNVRISSDWIDADIKGNIIPGSLVAEAKKIMSSIYPALMPSSEFFNCQENSCNNFSFDILLKGNSAIYEFMQMPICPLSDIPINGIFDGDGGRFNISLSTPHIKYGRDKLIRETSFKFSLDSFLGLSSLYANTIFPAKKGDVQIEINLSGVNDNLNASILFNPSMESSIKGGVSLQTKFSQIPNPLTQKDELSVHIDILPSALSMKNTIWNIANGKIDYFGKYVSVKNFLVQHKDQYIKIDGVASEDPDDIMKVKLNDIDLDYIFSLLNINYVTFGGMASGEIVGSRLLTNTRSARTKFLRVKDLSYNGAVLGDGDLASTYFPKEQKVGIYALIKDPLTRERRANVNGGIWITRDSLSFDFDANKVNLQFMKPFVEAFCSDLKGFGSGKCKLYGTFSDIDLVGNLRADTISMKIDFTNTWYHAGNDSVYMGKGMIDVKPLTIYDDQGHSAELSGWLRHRYFHEPEFNFKISDAKSILCYDTNEKLNPLWYGTIYGTGSGQIAGRPGLVKIDMNMTSEANSRFYYVISDTEEAENYSFLTFTDIKKEASKAKDIATIPTYLHQFLNDKKSEEEGSSNVVLSLKGSVTDDALVTLIMDPIAGDKITARGRGALQMDYNMAANDFRMIGTYTLDEGNYYFTLQDIIIKNFNIKPGSSIKFNGDPMDANLNIAATYRVNTNLTDLDESFASDKELNRTNVPVDAILLVDGPMTHPDITFDIELPTLTSDVERKVKSIVSTNDMMSRQIIYLLALNRFYTPEYTGSSSNSGAEWSSMASSTLSSQLSNILSNMTDKLNVAPSFRSDKGDFTDLEFDLALSSRLLNNRLLINGNFGYRDKQTSNTQFVGDFDIEYLLSKNGNLRLKAYNHFNDQNYYLRSALTTQGVGVVFRRDFDDLFKFRKKKKSFLLNNLFDRKEKIEATGDTIQKGSLVDSVVTDSITKKN